VRFRHGNTIIGLALSPDGKTLASVGGDYEQRTITFWEAHTGRPLRSLPRLGERIAFAPQGNLLAAGSYRTLGWIDLNSGKVLKQWEGHAHTISSVAFSRDGTRLLSGSDDQTAAVWEVPSGKLLHRFTGLAKGVSLAAFTPDGKRLILVSRTGGVRIHDAESAREVRRFQATLEKEEHHRGALSPDGKVLAVPGREALVLWNVDTGEPLHPKPPPLDKKLDEVEQIVRELSYNKSVEGLPKESAEVLGLAFSPDGKVLLATAGHEREMFVIDVARNRVVRKLPGSAGTWHALFFPDGKTIAAAGSVGLVQLWDSETGRELSTPRGHRARVKAIAFAPNGRTLASTAFQEGAWLWQLSTGRLLARMDHGKHVPAVLAFSPDGKQLAGATDEADLRLWDPATGKRQFSLKPPRPAVNGTNWVGSLAFSPDGKLLASAAIPTRLWDAEQGQHKAALGKGRYHAAAFAPDGTVLASAGEAITLWDPASGQAKREFGSGTTYSFLQFVEGGGTLLSGDARGVLSFWSLPRGKLTRQLNTGYAFRAMAVSPDGLTAVTAGGKHEVRDARGYLVPSQDPMTVRLWDLVLGKEIRRWQGHTAAIQAVAFAPDGRTVASAGNDTCIVIWDATGRAQQDPPPATPAGLERLGRDLVGDDAERASLATWALIATGEPGVAFLRKRWFRTKEVAEKEIRAWVDALADDREEVRRRARHELEKLGLPAWSALRKINETPLAAQVRDRLEEILDRLRPLFLAELRLQRRSVMILEQVGSASARGGLTELVALAVEPTVAAEGQAALARLSSR